MKLIAPVKLNTTPEQSEALLQTMERANVVCNRLSEFAWEHKVFGQYALHGALYPTLRTESGLTAQVVVRAISKVADAYKLDKKVKRVFTPHGSITYDDRILRWEVQKRQVSLWTIDGRLKISYSCGETQQHLLKSRQGESDLVYRDGEWFLFATCNVEEPPAIDLKGVVGVDLGIVEIAFDSLGNSYSGEAVKSLRKRVKKHRSGLQHQANKHHSKSAYRRLCKQQPHLGPFVHPIGHAPPVQKPQRRLLLCFSGIHLRGFKVSHKRAAVFACTQAEKPRTAVTDDPGILRRFRGACLSEQRHYFCDGITMSRIFC